VLEKRALRRKFGLKREKVARCRKLRNEELHNFYGSQIWVG